MKFTNPRKLLASTGIATMMILALGVTGAHAVDGEVTEQTNDTTVQDPAPTETVSEAPPLPELGAPGECIVNFGGQTLYTLKDNGVTERKKVSEDGSGDVVREVNSDGWGEPGGPAIRNYIATHEPLENVTYTIEIAQGATWAEGEPTLITGNYPGTTTMGQLNNNGYTVAVDLDGVKVEKTDTTIKLTIASMPAHSALVIYNGAVLDGSNQDVYIDHVARGTEPNCLPETVPEDPAPQPDPEPTPEPAPEPAPAPTPEPTEPVAQPKQPVSEHAKTAHLAETGSDSAGEWWAAGGLTAAGGLALALSIMRRRRTDAEA